MHANKTQFIVLGRKLQRAKLTCDSIVSED